MSRPALTPAPHPAEPGLSRRRIRELADWYIDQADQRRCGCNLATTALDAELRGLLREEVFPEAIEAELSRVLDAVFAV